LQGSWQSIKIEMAEKSPHSLRWVEPAHDDDQGAGTMQRRRYENVSGDSGVRDYEPGPTFIRVWFATGGGYEYDYEIPGPLHVEEMKRLAEAGEGLATYINQEVRKNYARKL
jgi:hypothetical protein